MRRKKSMLLADILDIHREQTKGFNISAEIFAKDLWHFEDAEEHGAVTVEEAKKVHERILIPFHGTNSNRKCVACSNKEATAGHLDSQQHKQVLSEEVMMDRLFGQPIHGSRRFCSMDTPFPCTQKYMREFWGMV